MRSVMVVEAQIRIERIGSVNALPAIRCDAGHGPALIFPRPVRSLRPKASAHWRKPTLSSPDGRRTKPLTAARDLRHERFLMVAADEAAAGVSGCSIDALRRMDRLDRRSASISSSTGRLPTATAERSAMCRGIASRR